MACLASQSLLSQLPFCDIDQKCNVRSVQLEQRLLSRMALYSISQTLFMVTKTYLLSSFAGTLSTMLTHPPSLYLQMRVVPSQDPVANTLHMGRAGIVSLTLKVLSIITSLLQRFCMQQLQGLPSANIAKLNGHDPVLWVNKFNHIIYRSTPFILN